MLGLAQRRRFAAQFADCGKRIPDGGVLADQTGCQIQSLPALGIGTLQITKPAIHDHLVRLRGDLVVIHTKVARHFPDRLIEAADGIDQNRAGVRHPIQIDKRLGQE